MLYNLYYENAREDGPLPDKILEYPGTAKTYFPMEFIIVFKLSDSFPSSEHGIQFPGGGVHLDLAPLVGEGGLWRIL